MNILTNFIYQFLICFFGTSPAFFCAGNGIALKVKMYIETGSRHFAAVFLKRYNRPFVSNAVELKFYGEVLNCHFQKYILQAEIITPVIEKGCPCCNTSNIVGEDAFFNGEPLTNHLVCRGCGVILLNHEAGELQIVHQADMVFMLLDQAALYYQLLHASGIVMKLLQYKNQQKPSSHEGT